MAVKFPYQNQVLISGRLTKDPEFRSTQKGITVCYFDIASNRRYKDNTTGEWKEDTTFVPIIAWGQVADRCKDKIKKGNPVYIEGRLSTSQYTNKEGAKVNRLRIVANKIQIIESTEEKSPSQPDSISEPDKPEIDNIDNVDDIPF